MKTTTYILKHYGQAVAVIVTENEGQLNDKVKTAIQEEVGAEKDGQFSLNISRMGDWGEDTPIKTTYVSDGELIEDDEFKLMKTVSY